MTVQTFAHIASLANALPFGQPDDLADRVKYMVFSAELNAHETIHRDKAASEADFDALALASLETNLCYSDDNEVCKWFTDNDVAY